MKVSVGGERPICLLGCTGAHIAAARGKVGMHASQHDATTLAGALKRGVEATQMRLCISCHPLLPAPCRSTLEGQPVPEQRYQQEPPIEATSQQVEATEIIDLTAETLSSTPPSTAAQQPAGQRGTPSWGFKGLGKGGSLGRPLPSPRTFTDEERDKVRQEAGVASRITPAPQPASQGGSTVAIVPAPILPTVEELAAWLQPHLGRQIPLTRQAGFQKKDSVLWRNCPQGKTAGSAQRLSGFMAFFITLENPTMEARCTDGIRVGKHIVGSEW